MLVTGALGSTISAGCQKKYNTTTTTKDGFVFYVVLLVFVARLNLV